MHIKFLRHGQGSAGGAVGYLLQARDHQGERRAEVSVLRGDPSLVAHVADSSRHKWGYTSGIIAWAPGDAPTDAQIHQVIQEWEATAFAGLAPDQYASCAVLHRDDDGTAHIHTLTARVELSSGHALNIAPPGHERLFDPLRDAWNHAQGWARPDDPARARRVQPGNEQHRSRSDHHPRNRAAITEHIEALIAEGQVTTAQEVRQALAEIGEITRAGAAYVSVRPEGEKQSIRLRGDLFREDWTIEQMLEREARRAQDAAAGNAGRINPDAAQRARERLASAVARRARYHRERYPREPDRDCVPDTIAKLADQRPDVVDSAVGESPHERTGNPAAAAVTAAAERIRAAGERAVETARTIADSAERATQRERGPEAGGSSSAERIRAAGERAVGTATTIADNAERTAGRKRHAATGDSHGARADAARDRGATPGHQAERSAQRGSVRRTDAAVERIIGAAERLGATVEQVKTAYQAWMARQAERDRQDRLVAETERVAAAASTPPTPQQPGELAKRILLMNNSGERLEAIRAADTGDNLDFVDALDENLADIGVGHLGELTPIADRRRAELLGKQPQELKHSKRDTPVSLPPEFGPKGPDMG